MGAVVTASSGLPTIAVSTMESPCSSDSETMKDSAKGVRANVIAWRIPRWKVVVSLGVVVPWVLLWLLLFSTPSKSERQQMLKVWVDGSLGVNMDAENDLDYSNECGLDHAWDKIIDPFVFCHGFGWFLATFALRDFWLTVHLFCLDELLELWWKHGYGNFAECWWDTLVLDFGCNFLGTIAGMAIVSRIWGERRFIPEYFFQSRSHMLMVLNITLSRTLMFFNLFGFKHMLWVPVAHPLNIYHIICYLLLLELSMDEMHHKLNPPFHEKMPYYTSLLWVYALIDTSLTMSMGYHWKIVYSTGVITAVIASLVFVAGLTSFSLWWNCPVKKEHHLKLYPEDEPTMSAVLKLEKRKSQGTTCKAKVE